MSPNPSHSQIMDTNRQERNPGRLPRLGRLAVVFAAMALLGVLAANASAGKYYPNADCGWSSLATPFAQFGDSNWYFPVAGGSFENGPAWSLSGGATVATPNEPWNVNGAGDHLSLGLPNGASATTAPVCVTTDSPALRLFAVNTGSSNRNLQVSVNYTGTDGRAHSDKLTDQKNSGSWGTTQQISFADKINNVLTQNGKAMVTFTFSSPYQRDSAANWRIDDVYVDDISGHCNWPSFSNPFGRWNDTNPYFLLDGGSFESGAPAWSLSGGANVATPNEPWNVNGTGDRKSLGLPNGASATSPSVCVTVDSPSMRLFVVNSGDSSRQLQITINYTGNDGKIHSAKLPDQKNTGSWAPTQSIQFLNPIQDLLKKNGQTLVTFTFASQYQRDHAGNWRIDDVEVDPLKSH